MTYASFWKRTAAYVVDSVIFSVILWAALFVLGLVSALVIGNTNGQENPVAGLIVLALSSFAFVGVYLAYYVWPESSSWQATIGKKLLGLKVTDTNGQRISFWRSLGRNLGMVVSTIIFYIGYLMCLWTEKKQCLHDQMADCLVVDTNENNKNGCVVAIIIAVFMAFITVFIVGILSAIAMPQYFRAVEKARATEAITLLSTLAQSQQRHYSRTKRFAPTFTQLDVAPAGATGNTFYTKGDPKTGTNGQNRDETPQREKAAQKRQKEKR